MVLDNLIHRKELPVIIAIFISAGSVPGAPQNGLEGNRRSLEFDTLSGRYASFLMEEILPEEAKSYTLRSDASGRGICGISSGGNYPNGFGTPRHVFRKTRNRKTIATTG